MRIGELSRRTGATRDTIRFYERQGLLACGEREGENNYKSYPEEAVMTINVIRDAQATGISISDLSILLSQLAAKDAEDFDGEVFLSEKIAEVEARIESSERFLQTLLDTREALAVAHLPD